MPSEVCILNTDNQKLFNKHLSIVITKYNECFNVLKFFWDVHSIHVPISYIGKWQFSKMKCYNFNIVLHITIYWVGNQHYFLFFLIDILIPRATTLQTWPCDIFLMAFLVDNPSFMAAPTLLLNIESFFFILNICLFIMYILDSLLAHQ